MCVFNCACVCVCVFMCVCVSVCVGGVALAKVVLVVYIIFFSQAKRFLN